MTERYKGEERRECPQFEIRPSHGWWGQVTLPLIVGLVIQAGGIVWWASKIEADQIALKSNVKQSITYQDQKYTALLAEIRENRRLIIDVVKDR